MRTASNLEFNKDDISAHGKEEQIVPSLFPSISTQDNSTTRRLLSKLQDTKEAKGKRQDITRQLRCILAARSITPQTIPHVVIIISLLRGTQIFIVYLSEQDAVTVQKWSPDERSIMSAYGTVPKPPPPRWLFGVPRRYCK
ncbi:hypothetical protein CDAR_110951 [Caerostris darwini]|uniref:Uncharacterized protein n=1 Tax=Caerostris darwini TaxID=1538125 RepID=A0AAV4QQT3_9ARAC|nr:hypothetical protein CDAR_110951 [Caerostris darwini]